MDKIEFLALLAVKLSSYPISQEAVEMHVGNMKRYFDTISNEEFAMENPSEEDAEIIAENLYKKYHSEVSTPAAETETDTAEEEVSEEAEEQEDQPITYAVDIEPAVEGTAEPAVEETAEPTVEASAQEEAESVEEETASSEENIAEEENADDFLEQLAKETEEERRDQARAEELKQVAIARAQEDDPELVAQIFSEEATPRSTAETVQEEFDPIIDAVDPQSRPDVAFEESELSRIFEAEDTDSEYDYSIEDFEESEAMAEPENEGFENMQKPERVKREKVKGSPLFWALFILTLPITLPILAVITVFFGIIYIAVTLLIVAFSLIMVSVVAGGTALALIGIIYGITQCFGNLPIGLFEIGLGIAIGGVTMLVSVLLYNLAVRFIPRLYKLVNRFAGTVYSKIGDLFYTLKKECGKK